MVSARYFRGDRTGELLLPLSYSDEHRLFYNSDQTLGFAFQCRPLTAGDHKTAERLGVMLKDDYPADTMIQFCLIGSENIQPQITHMKDLRSTQDDPLLRETIDRRAEHLTRGVSTPVERRSGLRIRDLQLVITIKLPLSNSFPSDSELARAKELRVSVEKSLETVGLHPVALTAQMWLDVMLPLINHGPNASWRKDGKGVLGEDKLLRDQVFDYDNDVRVRAKGLSLGGTEVRTLSVKRFPQRLHFGQAASFIGDMWEGLRGIRMPFLLTANIHLPDPLKAKTPLATKKQWATNQAVGHMSTFVPALRQKKQDFDALFEALDDGDRVSQIYLGLVLFADSEDAATAGVSAAQSYWGELGYNVLQDSLFVLPLFLNLLPFGAEVAAIRDTKRYQTMGTRHIVPLIPIFGDWQGTGTPIINLISRNGQLMNLSLFDSRSNMNAVIAASSGSGKSFFTNEIISSYLSVGGAAWAIDVGRSYEKLCDTLDGEFWSFETDRDICLNPFPMIREYDDEVDMLIGLLTTMAAPTEGLSDFQTSGLKRILKEQWDEHAKNLSVDLLAEALKADPHEEIQRIGHQLYSFTTKGEYGRYFNGPNNVRFENRFTVLELDQLEGRKHLQRVVLLMLIYQITAELYLGERDRPKLILIDEAWAHLTEGEEAMGKFIEKAFRRARKHGGSITVITQSVNDLYSAPVGKAIAANAANMFLLGQKAEDIDSLKRESRLPLSESGYELVKTVHTVKGAYSEIFCITDYGAGIGRLIVDPFVGLLYSTAAEDVNAIKLYRDRGYSVRDAINAVLEDRSQARAA
ncbi:type IV secretion system protein TraC [Azospirillum sp. SYSU D00513]|uniref:type IV secretion system protein TraC n=1 Tax=Azospirillum sp. SYSU D00513 TaxID=2812561 RepID=UPI001A961944|nr:type IV secretion system protein TraC [Azospirillum sp. SYSU D00513]